jgi:hypothetical protein
MTEPVRRVRGRKRLMLALAISLAILGVLFWKADARFSEIAQELRRVNGWFLAAIAVFSVTWHIFLGADKWWRILRALGAQVPYWEVFRVRLGSDPIRIAAPLKAGEVVNAAYFARLESFGFSRAAGSVVFDKALNFFGTVFWLYVGIAALASIPTAGYVALHTAMAAALLVVICVRPVRQAAVALARLIHARLGRLAAGVLSAFEEFTPFQKIGFLLYGVVFQIRPLMVCWLLLVAFQPARFPTLLEFLALGSIVVLMSNIPSFAGMGPREAALMTAFADYADPLTLLSVGLMMSILVQVLPAVVGIPWMFPLVRAVASGTSLVQEDEVSEPLCATDESTSGGPDEYSVSGSM